MVHRLLALTFDDETVETVGLEDLFDDVVLPAAAREHDLDLKILLRLKKLALDMEQALHADEDDRRPRSDEVHARARRHAHAGRCPHTRGGRQSVDLVLAVDDDARAQKSDPRNDLRRHAGSVRLDRIAEAVLRHHHDERAPRAHDGMRADARLLIAQFPLIPDGKAQHHCKQNIQQMIQILQHIVFPVPRLKCTDAFAVSFYDRHISDTRNLREIFFQNLGRIPVVLNDFLIEIRARLRRTPIAVCPIDGNKPEFRQIRTPFIIVEKRPIEISAHIHALFDRGMERIQILRQKDDAQAVILARISVFRDINRFVFQTHQAVIDGFRIKFIQIKVLHFDGARLGERITLPFHVRFSHIYHAAGIDIDRPEIAGIFDVFVEKRVGIRQDNLARADRMEEKFVIDHVKIVRRRLIERIELPLCEIHHERVCTAHGRGRILLDHMVPERMKEQAVLLPLHAVFAQPQVELIEHVPEIHVLRDLRQDIMQIPFKISAVIEDVESPFQPKPLRNGLVYERDERPDPLLFEQDKLLHIMIRRLFVEHALLRLNARPLDPETVRLMPESFKERGVLAVHLIRIARRSGNLCGRIAPEPLLLIVPKVRPNVVAFDLKRRRRAAPQKIFREPKRGDIEYVSH